jgi:hypothetical protein
VSGEQILIFHNPQIYKKCLSRPGWKSIPRPALNK